MIEKYRATTAHKNSLNLLQGYPTPTQDQDLLLSYNATTLAVDGNGHMLAPNDEEVTFAIGRARFGQGTVSIEQPTSNKITDAGLLNLSDNFVLNWAGSPTSPSSSGLHMIAEMPVYFQGVPGYRNLSNDSFISPATATTWSLNYISGIAAGNKVMQSCWVKTDASSVRFSVYSTQTGHHYDTYIDIDANRWQFAAVTSPYTIIAADLASGGQIRQFHIETTSDANELYVFYLQTEIGDFATSWTETSRGPGVLSYERSYFNPAQFSIGGWFYIKNLSGDRNALFSICDNHGSTYKLVAYTDNTGGSELIISAWSDVELLNISTGYPVVEDTWFHVMLTYDGLNYKCYVDDELNSTITETRRIEFDQDALLYIGTWFDQDFLNGYVNDFIISSRVFDYHLIDHLYDTSTLFYRPQNYIAQV